MALALNTSKRKFHKLLDNLTNSSSTSLPTHAANTSTASLPAPSEPPSKRSHLSSTVSKTDTDRPVTARSRPPTTSSDRPRSVRVVGAHSTVRPSSTSSAVQPSQSPPRTPNYAPLSRPLFLARLQTYADVRLWTPKPDALSEVVWASRGWVCEALDTVACKGGCEARIVIKMHPRRTNPDLEDIDGTEDLAEEIDAGLVERYRGLIVEGHGEGCLWRRAGCREGIYRMPVDRGMWAEGVSERYKTFEGMEEEVPGVECCKIPLVEGLSLGQLCARAEEKYWRPKQHTTAEGQADKPAAPAAVPALPNTPALALTLFGWSLEKTHSIAVLRCHDCFQRIGLWLYKAEKLKNDAARLELNEDDLKLSLLTAHREHCPWKNAETQANPPDSRWAGKAFWEMLQEDVVAAARTSVELKRGRESPEGVEGEEGERIVPSRAEVEEQDRAMKKRLDKVKRAWSTITRKKSTAVQRPQSG